MTDREHLAKLLAENALVVNRQSGDSLDYYIDARRVTLSGIGASYVGSVVLELVRRHAPGVKVIGGMELGATAVIMATVIASARESEPLHAFLIRTVPRAKKNSKWRWTEGYCQRTSVVIVEDVTTDGNSIAKVAGRAKEEGMTVEAAISLVDREQGAKGKLQSICPLYSVFTSEELFNLSRGFI